jgi:hypothetical protein
MEPNHNDETGNPPITSWRLYPYSDGDMDVDDLLSEHDIPDDKNMIRVVYMQNRGYWPCVFVIHVTDKKDEYETSVAKYMNGMRASMDKQRYGETLEYFDSKEYTDLRSSLADSGVHIYSYSSYEEFERSFHPLLKNIKLEIQSGDDSSILEVMSVNDRRSLLNQNPNVFLKPLIRYKNLKEDESRDNLLNEYRSEVSDILGDDTIPWIDRYNKLYKKMVSAKSTLYTEYITLVSHTNELLHSITKKGVENDDMWIIEEMGLFVNNSKDHYSIYYKNQIVLYHGIDGLSPQKQLETVELAAELHEVPLWFINILDNNRKFNKFIKDYTGVFLNSYINIMKASLVGNTIVKETPITLNRTTVFPKQFKTAIHKTAFERYPYFTENRGLYEECYSVLLFLFSIRRMTVKAIALGYGKPENLSRIDNMVTTVYSYLLHPFLLSDMLPKTVTTTYAKQKFKRKFNKMFESYKANKKALVNLTLNTDIRNELDSVIHKKRINRYKKREKESLSVLTVMGTMNMINKGYSVYLQPIKITKDRLMSANMLTEGTEYYQEPFPTGKEEHQFNIELDNPITELLNICNLGNNKKDRSAMNEFLYKTLLKFMKEPYTQMSMLTEITDFYVMTEPSYINNSIMETFKTINKNFGYKELKSPFTIHGQIKDTFDTFKYLETITSGQELEVLQQSNTQFITPHYFNLYKAINTSQWGTAISVMRYNKKISNRTLSIVFNLLYVFFEKNGRVEFLKLLSHIKSSAKDERVVGAYTKFMEHIVYMSVYEVVTGNKYSPTLYLFREIVNDFTDIKRNHRELKAVEKSKDMLKEQFLLEIEQYTASTKVNDTDDDLGDKQIIEELNGGVSIIERDILETPDIIPTMIEDDGSQKPDNIVIKSVNTICMHSTLDQEISFLRIRIQKTMHKLKSIETVHGIGGDAYKAGNKMLTGQWNMYKKRKKTFDSYVSGYNRCNRCGVELFYDITHKKSYAEIKEKMEVIEKEKASGVLQERLGREQLLTHLGQCKTIIKSLLSSDRITLLDRFQMEKTDMDFDDLYTYRNIDMYSEQPFSIQSRYENNSIIYNYLSLVNTGLYYSLIEFTTKRLSFSSRSIYDSLRTTHLRIISYMHLLGYMARDQSITSITFRNTDGDDYVVDLVKTNGFEYDDVMNIYGFLHKEDDNDKRIVSGILMNNPDSLVNYYRDIYNFHTRRVYEGDYFKKSDRLLTLVTRYEEDIRTEMGRQYTIHGIFDVKELTTSIPKGPKSLDNSKILTSFMTTWTKRFYKESGIDYYGNGANPDKTSHGSISILSYLYQMISHTYLDKKGLSYTEHSNFMKYQLNTWTCKTPSRDYLIRKQNQNRTINFIENDFVEIHQWIRYSGSYYTLQEQLDIMKEMGEDTGSGYESTLLYYNKVKDWMPKDGDKSVITAHDYFTNMIEKDETISDFRDITLHDLLGVEYEFSVYNTLYAVFIQLFQTYHTFNTTIHDKLVSTYEIEEKNNTGDIVRLVTNFLANNHYHGMIQFKSSVRTEKNKMFTILITFIKKFNSSNGLKLISEYVIRNINHQTEFKSIFLSNTDYYDTFHEKTSGNHQIDTNRISSYLRITNKYSWILSSRELNTVLSGGKGVTEKLNYYVIDTNDGVYYHTHIPFEHKDKTSLVEKFKEINKILSISNVPDSDRVTYHEVGKHNSSSSYRLELRYQRLLYAHHLGNTTLSPLSSTSRGKDEKRVLTTSSEIKRSLKRFNGKMSWNDINRSEEVLSQTYSNLRLGENVYDNILVMKTELGRRNMSTQGEEAELVERLEASDVIAKILYEDLSTNMGLKKDMLLYDKQCNEFECLYRVLFAFEDDAIPYISSISKDGGGLMNTILFDKARKCVHISRINTFIMDTHAYFDFTKGPIPVRRAEKLTGRKLKRIVGSWNWVSHDYHWQKKRVPADSQHLYIKVSETSRKIRIYCKLHSVELGRGGKGDIPVTSINQLWVDNHDLASKKKLTFTDRNISGYDLYYNKNKGFLQSIYQIGVKKTPYVTTPIYSKTTTDNRHRMYDSPILYTYLLKETITTKDNQSVILDMTDNEIISTIKGIYEEIGPAYHHFIIRYTRGVYKKDCVYAFRNSKGVIKIERGEGVQALPKNNTIKSDEKKRSDEKKKSDKKKKSKERKLMLQTYLYRNLMYNTKMYTHLANDFSLQDYLPNVNNTQSEIIPDIRIQYNREYRQNLVESKNKLFKLDMKRLYILLPYFQNSISKNDITKLKKNPSGITGKGGVTLDDYFLPDIETKQLDELNISLNSEEVVTQELIEMIDLKAKRRKIKYAKDHDRRKQDGYENINRVTVNRFGTDVDFPYMDVIDLFSLFETKQDIKSYEHDLDATNRSFDLSSLTKIIINNYHLIRRSDYDEFSKFSDMKVDYSDLFYKNMKYKIQLVRELALHAIEKIDDRTTLDMITRNIMKHILTIIKLMGKEVKNSPVFYDFILRHVNMFDRNRTMVIKQRTKILNANRLLHASKKKSLFNVSSYSNVIHDIRDITVLDDYLTKKVGVVSIEVEDNLMNVYKNIMDDPGNYNMEHN